jgi:hypothetical protein
MPPERAAVRLPPANGLGWATGPSGRGPFPAGIAVLGCQRRARLIDQGGIQWHLRRDPG